MTKAEIIESLIKEADLREWIAKCNNDRAARADANCVQALREAAELLKAAPEWISVKDKLPENEKAVLAYAKTRKENGAIRGHVVKAFYTDGKHHAEDSAFDWDTDYSCDYLRYDSENDKYYVPKGWWESVRYSDRFSAIDDFVTHWRPLPEPPKEEVTHEQD